MTLITPLLIASQTGYEVHTCVWDVSSWWGFSTNGVSLYISPFPPKMNDSSCPNVCRFLVDMPSGLVFIIFAILLRMTEGVGWSMCTTTTFSLLAQLFPTRVGTVTVWKPSLNRQDHIWQLIGFLSHQDGAENIVRSVYLPFKCMDTCSLVSQDHTHKKRFCGCGLGL